MINKNSVFLIVAFILLGGYVYFFEMEKKNESPDEEVEKIFYFDLNEVQGLKIRFQDESILIKKEKEKWLLKKPFVSLLKSKDVNDLISILNYGIVRVVNENPRDLSQWGLSQPEIELSFEVAEGFKPFSWKTLFIGKENPAMTSCYALVKGEVRVLMIGIIYKRELKRFFESIAKNQPTICPA